MKGERGCGGYKPNLETLIYAGLPNARFLIFNLPFRTHGRGAINYSRDALMESGNVSGENPIPCYSRWQAQCGSHWER